MAVLLYGKVMSTAMSPAKEAELGTAEDCNAHWSTLSKCMQHFWPARLLHMSVQLMRGACYLLVRLFWRRSSTELRLLARTAAPPFSMWGRPSAAKCTPEWHTTGAIVTTTAPPPAFS